MCTHKAIRLNYPIVYMTTESQIKSNRENAQKSTGPNDTIKTKFNAIKHGLFSKKLITKEEKKDFEEIFQSLIDSYQPENIIELRIIEIMANAAWDLQRICHKESVNENNILTDDSILRFNPKEKKFVMPNEIFMKYKQEGENRFYKALKMLIDLRKNAAPRKIKKF